MGALIAEPFAPLAPLVWLSLVATLVYVGLIRWSIQMAEPHPEADEPVAEAAATQGKSQAVVADTATRSSLRRQDTLSHIEEMSNLEVVAKALVRTTSELAKGAGADASGRNRRSTGRKMRGRAWVAFKNMLFHQGLVFQGMLGDWRGDDPQVLSQWVLLIGSSFSMLVIITFYTAEVTHSLIYRGRTSTSITSFTDVIAQNMPVCALESMRTAFEAHFTDEYERARLHSLYVPVSDMSDVLVGMEDGRCTVGVMTQEMWAFAGLTAADHCTSKTALSTMLISLDVAFPITANLVRPLSWAISMAVENGEWEYVRAMNELQFKPSGGCSTTAGRRLTERRLKALAVVSSSSASAASGTILQLDLTGAAGPLIIAVLTATLALLINMVERGLLFREKKIKQNWKTLDWKEKKRVIGAFRIRRKRDADCVISASHESSQKTEATRAGEEATADG